MEILLENNITDGDEEPTSNTTTDNSGESVNVQNVAIFSVLSGVLFIVLCVLVAVTVFCIRRGKHASETPNTAVSNPTYEGKFFFSCVAFFSSYPVSILRHYCLHQTLF